MKANELMTCEVLIEYEEFNGEVNKCKNVCLKDIGESGTLCISIIKDGICIEYEGNGDNEDFCYENLKVNPEIIKIFAQALNNEEF